MPEVMAKFPRKKKPGERQKKKRRYVKVLEMIDTCCGISMVTTAALELIEHRVLESNATSNITTLTSPDGVSLTGRAIEFEQILAE